MKRFISIAIGILISGFIFAGCDFLELRPRLPLRFRRLSQLPHRLQPLLSRHQLPSAANRTRSAFRSTGRLTPTTRAST